jgi:hypothetical protein
MDFEKITEFEDYRKQKIRETKKNCITFVVTKKENYVG